MKTRTHPSFGMTPTHTFFVCLLLLGMLQYLSTRCCLTLLQCLQDSYQTAAEFDSRPGLKFLMQKVAKAEVASNMYKQVGVIHVP